MLLLDEYSAIDAMMAPKFMQKAKPKVNPIKYTFSPMESPVQSVDLLSTFPMMLDKSYGGFLFPAIPATYASELIPKFVEAMLKPSAKMVNQLHKVYQNTAASGLLNSTLGQNIMSRAMESYFNNAFNRLGTGIQLLGSLGRVSTSQSPGSYLSFLKFLIG